MWWRLVFKEILKRKWGFLFSILAVAVAVGAWVLVESVTASLKAEAAGLGAEAGRLKDESDRMKNETDRILAGMTQNLLIVPAAVPEDRYYRGDFGDEYLPEWIVGALLDPNVLLRIDTRADSMRQGQPRIRLIDKRDADPAHTPKYVHVYELAELADHYTAELQSNRVAQAGERKMDVIMTGQRREAGRKSKRPLVVPAERGQAHLGSAVAARLALRPGDRFELAGRPFTVGRVEPEQASLDDIRVYLALADAQDILGKPGLVNRVLALSCQCEGVSTSQLAEILDLYVRQWSSTYLARAGATTRPGATSGAERIQIAEPLAVRVTPMTRIATARENMRNSIESQRSSIEGQRQSVEGLHHTIKGVTGALIPMLGAIMAVLIGGYFYFNVRERQQEIGVLLAIGYTPGPIIAALLLKLALVSLIGAAVGVPGGALLTRALATLAALPLHQVVQPGYVWPVALAGSAGLTLLAGIYPLWVAARTEAADILRNS